jgi:hypothetical protein
MFRIFSCVALCALPLAMSSPASAQSYISVTGGAEVEAPAPLGPPMSITQRYVPQASQAREMSLLVDETQNAAPPAAVAAVTVTTPAAPATTRMAVNNLGIGSRAIVVSNVRGLNE